MRRLTRIALATDFSEESRHARDQAIVLAQSFGASLLGLHVHTPQDIHLSDLGLAAPPGDGAPSESERSMIEQQLAVFLRPARAVGVATTVRLWSAPSISEGILMAADEDAADLIVLGTHGAQGFQRLVLGSVAERVVRRSTIPVMTVPPHLHTSSALPYRHVLCPVDVDQPSEVLVPLAASMAREFAANLTLLHVLERGLTTPSSALLRKRRAQAGARLEALAAGNDHCRAEVRDGEGAVWQTILAIAARERADLLVVGAGRHRSAARSLLGTTAQQIARRATCPVITVHA